MTDILNEGNPFQSSIHFTVDLVCISVYKFTYDQQRDYQAT